MQVKILVAGTYLNAELRAQKCQVGDLLETREWYAQQMAADGSGEVTGAEAPKKRKPSKMQEKSGGKKPPLPSNPFLG